MPEAFGTRTKAELHYERVTQGSQTRFFSRDVGMTKNVTASITFGGGAATGANGTFTNTFAVNDPVLIEGCSLNNGYFTITALDTVNGAFLALDPPPKAEGPLNVNIRTP